MKLINTTLTENAKVELQNYITEELSIKDTYGGLLNLQFKLAPDFSKIPGTFTEVQKAEFTEAIDMLLKNQLLEGQLRILNEFQQSLRTVLDNDIKDNTTISNNLLTLQVPTLLAENIVDIEPVTNEVESNEPKA